MSLTLVKHARSHASRDRRRERAAAAESCYLSRPEIRAAEINILDQEKSLNVCHGYAAK